MKYEKQILEAFARLKFDPRPGQIDAVNQVVVACIDDKKRNVILNAPTGVGKSLIGAVSAEVLHSIKHGNIPTPKASIMLTATNVLARQYANTFEALEGGNNFMILKGAGNYDCDALGIDEATGSQTTAEHCAFFTMLQNKSQFTEILDKHCEKCQYLDQKKRRNSVRHLTTNYSFYFLDRMYTGKFEDRELIVWDEAHLVNDLFSEHNAIHFSQKTCLAMAKEIAETVRITDVEIAKTLSQIGKDCATRNKITDDNYEAYLHAMHKIYAYAVTAGQTEADKALREGNMGKFRKMNSFKRKYEGRGCKIDDLFKYGYDHVFEYKEADSSVSVKPVFVGTMMANLEAGRHNLFMSATVSPEFMMTTLNLAPADTAFIKLPPTFAKENKEIVFMDPQSLSYTSLQNPEVLKKLRANTAKIVKKHVADGDRGIILAPSFKLQNEIVDELGPQIKAGAFKLFEHRQGEKLEFILAAFKEYAGGPAVLISPSMYEGIDLPGDLSRFQVVVKAPYPSLGDKRMKFILDKHPHIYETITIMKLVQGAGRSVRSQNDHAVTYMLDLNAQRLWKSKSNLWKDEFNVRYTQFI